MISPETFVISWRGNDWNVIESLFNLSAHRVVIILLTVMVFTSDLLRGDSSLPLDFVPPTLSGVLPGLRSASSKSFVRLRVYPLPGPLASQSCVFVLGLFALDSRVHLILRKGFPPFGLLYLNRLLLSKFLMIRSLTKLSLLHYSIYFHKASKTANDKILT